MAKIAIPKASSEKACAGANIPALDGCPEGTLGPSPKGDSWCTMCGERGHKASAHAGGKAMVRDTSTAGDPGNDGGGLHGPATTANRAAQYGIADNDSELTTGNKNYTLPGERGGPRKTIRIFG